MRFLTRFAAITVAILLTGCAFLDEGTPNVCPSTAILDDAGELVRFASAPPKGPGDIAFQTRMKRLTLLCEVDDKSVEMDLFAAMEVVRGPANPKGEAKFVYFIAILDKDKNILNRIKFPMIAQFQRRETKLEFTEDMVVTIPKKETALPKDFYVYLGFEMTPEELAYNRKRRQIR